MPDVEKRITNNKSRIYLQTIMCLMLKSLIYIRSPQLTLVKVWGLYKLLQKTLISPLKMNVYL